MEESEICAMCYAGFPRSASTETGPSGEVFCSPKCRTEYKAKFYSHRPQLEEWTALNRIECATCKEYIQPGQIAFCTGIGAEHFCSSQCATNFVPKAKNNG